jgi:putative ABC transport system permease protein
MTWEIALALILVAGALLLFRSLQVFNRLDLGFHHERVVTMKISVPENRYRTPLEVTTFFNRTLAAIQPLPGISEAALINLLPVIEPHASSNFSIRGRAPAAPGHEPASEHRLITPAYFRAMGIPLVSGRAFADADLQGPVRAVIINQRTADLYWPGQNPLGQWIAIGTQPKPNSWMQIVGVVGNVRHAGPYRPYRTALYLPVSRLGTEYAWPTMNLVVRSARDPEPLIEMLRAKLRELDPEAAVHQSRTMAAVVAEVTEGTRLLARLLTLFGGLAVLLALAGVYGVMSCLVAERTHEIGVRLSLGSTRRQVLELVLARGLRTGFLGVLLGFLCTLPLLVLARHYLVGVGFAYLWSFLAAGLGLLAITLAASLLPAWRATRVDPLVALRDE